MAASVDEKEREEEEGGRKRRSRNLACTSINLHLLVRALPRPRLSFDQGAPELSIREDHTPALSILKFEIIFLSGQI